MIAWNLSRLARRARLAPAVIALVFQPALASEPAGTVKTSKGQVQVERSGQRLPAKVGDPVLVSDRVVTGADSAVGITLRDNTMLTAGQNSTLELNRFAFDSTTHAGALEASVKRGSLAVISGKLAKASPDTVRYSTPSMTLGVRGTEFVIEAGEGSN